MTLIIYKDKNTVILSDFSKGGFVQIGNISTSFGNVFCVAESVFPQDCFFPSKTAFIDFEGISIQVSSSAVSQVRDFIGSGGKFSVEKVDILRSVWHISESPIFYENYQNDGSVMMFTVNSFTDLVYGLLHFYGAFGYTLKICASCRRWFAVAGKSARNVRFCSRKSVFCFQVPHYGNFVEIDLTNVKCGAAVKELKKHINFRLRSIQQKFDRSTKIDGDFTSFVQNINLLLQAFDTAPTTENAVKVFTALYAVGTPIKHQH